MYHTSRLTVDQYVNVSLNLPKLGPVQPYDAT